LRDLADELERLASEPSCAALQAVEHLHQILAQNKRLRLLGRRRYVALTVLHILATTAWRFHLNWNLMIGGENIS
jgi:hypothetical protein